MNVFCFDFDGVICDSAPETAVTAWRGCEVLWPSGAGEIDPAAQDRFCRLRPVIHTGFEAIPLMRLIREGEADDATILADFAALRDGVMGREGVSAERLQQVFGEVRDGLIAADPEAWLRWNVFYPGVRDTLTAAIARHATFVITTKQERFVQRLFAHNAVEMPAEDIYGLERKRSKPELLAELMACEAHAGATFHFIEDRFDTLQDVIARPDLEPVRLYLADWGYNTPAQREQAAGMDRINVVSVEDFRRVVG